MNTAQPSALLDHLVSSLDLDDYEDMQTGELTLVNPKTLAPTTSKITLAGKEHPARKRIDMNRTRKLRASVASTGKLPNNDPIEDYDDETEYLVSVTLGWNLTKGGAPLQFSADAARQVYTDPKRQWLRQQALAGLQKTELFIASSAKP
jgi:hypothetical protein